MGVTICELVLYNQTYKNSIGGFYAKEINPYLNIPELDKNINLKDYSVNHPNLYLFSISENPESNVHAVYNIRSQAGINSDVPKRHADFLSNFGHPTEAVNGITEDLKDERLKDLIGCRYDVNNGQRVVREGALARFMLFHNYEVIENDQENLNVLSSNEFNPVQEIILSQDPGILLERYQSNAYKVEYTSIKSYIYKIDIENTAPGILYFGDSFNRYWKVFINGVEGKVLRANYKFMAVAVYPGRNEIVFKFKPAPFYQGLVIAVCGFLVFIFASLFLVLKEK
jgi:hypothetical protein